MIYLDHAATSPLRSEALAAMMPFLTAHYANASGAYAAGRAARSAVERARGQIASAIGAKPGEVYFTSGGSESDNWALCGTLCASSRKKIVTTKIEHHAILRTCEMLEKQGAEVVLLDVDSEGRVLFDQAANVIDGDTALVSVMLANNEVGTIQPVSEIAELAHRCGAVMHTDAVQAVGHIPVDVDALGVDLLSISAHKFGGPKGIGALYIRTGTRIDGFVLGGEQEMGMRAGTENVSGIVGAAAALEAACGHMEKDAAQLERLGSLMMEEIERRIPGAVINGSREKRLPGNVHVSFSGISSSVLLMLLDMRGIAASAGSACAAGAAERSHVLRAMGAPELADVRFTLGAENTEAEIRETVSALCDILRV